MLAQEHFSPARPCLAALHCAPWASSSSPARSSRSRRSSPSRAAVEAAFADPAKKEEVSAAFAESLADGLDGIAADDITITKIYFKAARRMQGVAAAGARFMRKRGSAALKIYFQAARRMQGLSERRLTDGELVVEYEIKVAANVDTTAVASSITAIDTTAVTAAVTTELKNVEGLEAVEVGEMKAPEAPEEADPCVAELGMVEKEMEEKPDGKEMDIDKACKAFRGFKKYCTKDDWSKLDAKELPDDAPPYDDLMKAEDQMCGACGFGFQKMMKMQMEEMKEDDDHAGHDHGKDGKHRALTPIRVPKALRMPDVRAMKLRIPSIVVPRFSFRNFGRRLEMHGDHGGRRLDGHDWEPSKAWCDESDKLFKDGSDCTPKDFEEMMEGMNDCGKGDYDGDKDHDGHDHAPGCCEHMSDCGGWFCMNCNCMDSSDAMPCEMCSHDKDDGHDGHDHEGPPACVAACIEQANAGMNDDAMKEMSEDAAMTAMEDTYKGMCGCDTATCDVMELEDVKMVIGVLCCNPDFVSGSSLLANGDCTGVQYMDFTEFVMATKYYYHDGHDHDDMGSGYGYGYGFIEEEIVHHEEHHEDGPPECVSACDGDICCDGGICSDCSISTCGQDDMDKIIGACFSQGSGGGAPDRPMDRGDMPHDHPEMGDDHGDGCGPPMKHKDMKMSAKIMCSPCMKLLDDMNEGMGPDSKMEDFCAAGGPLDKFKKGCPAKDFDEIMGFMMER